MAIYHFTAKAISMGKGESAVHRAAYHARTQLEDERNAKQTRDYEHKGDLAWSGIFAPKDAPAWTKDRQQLWNRAEKAERQANGQPARNLEFALPNELTREQQTRLLTDFAREQFARKGMVADVNVHSDYDAAGNRRQGADPAEPRNDHAHVLLTMRRLDGDGFSKTKTDAREWNSKEQLLAWREGWAKAGAKALQKAGFEIEAQRFAEGHRTLPEQRKAALERGDTAWAEELDREPDIKQGAASAQMEARGEDSDRADERRDVFNRNAEREVMKEEVVVLDRDLERMDRKEPPPPPRTVDEIMRETPALSLDTLTRERSTFTRRDIARLASKHTNTADEFTGVLARLEASRELVRLGKDARGQTRLTTRSMQAIERRMDDHAEALSARSRHAAGQTARPEGVALGAEQQTALAHILAGPDLVAVIGYAGSGKSTMLNVARQSWEQAGYRVRGMALSGVAADGLQQGAGIDSRTIHSRLYQWDKGEALPTARDVIVVDEAGMIGSRLMKRVLSHASDAGAKVVLVGDPQQLQAIEAGGALRAIIDRTKAAEITTIRRQRQGWQQEATRALATGRTGAALDAYEAAGMLHGHATTADAKEAVIEGWDHARQAHPEESQIILAFKRDDVRALNALARGRRQQAGELGRDHSLQTAQGSRDFAAGDRLYFLKNDRGMGIRNGSLATVERIEGKTVTVRLDNDAGRHLTFSTDDYNHIAHGYAATIHKSQGVTVDRAHVLATSNLDRHAAYVAMTRHREQLDVHWAKDSISSRAELTRTLARDASKDTTLDYGPDLEDEHADDREDGRPAGQGDDRAEARQQDEVRPDPAADRAAFEQDRFHTWANARRAERQSVRHDAETEQGRQHQAGQLDLDRRLKQEQAALRAQHGPALKAIRQRQQRTGLAGFLYRVTGQAAKDEVHATAIRITLAAFARREAEQRQALNKQQGIERAEFVRHHARLDSQLERRIDQARERRERDGWAQQKTGQRKAQQRTGARQDLPEQEKPTEYDAASSEMDAAAEKLPVEAGEKFAQHGNKSGLEATHGPNLGQGDPVAAEKTELTPEEQELAELRAMRRQMEERDRDDRRPGRER